MRVVTIARRTPNGEKSALLAPLTPLSGADDAREHNAAYAAHARVRRIESVLRNKRLLHNQNVVRLITNNAPPSITPIYNLFTH